MKRTFILGALFALAACPSAFAELAIGGRSAADGWQLQVVVEPARIGPIAVAVSGVRRAPESCSRCAPAWLQHDVVFENTGSRPVTFSGLGIAAELGPRGSPLLLAAGPPCSYASSKRRIQLACLAYLDIPTIKPGRSHTRTVTLWKGLRGTSALRPGTYVVHETLHFRVGVHAPEPGAGRAIRLRIVYRVVES